eukprot:scaffold335_cov142-Skeletonema_menzelii.AAC.14
MIVTSYNSKNHRKKFSGGGCRMQMLDANMTGRPGRGSGERRQCLDLRVLHNIMQMGAAAAALWLERDMES